MMCGMPVSYTHLDVYKRQGGRGGWKGDVPKFQYNLDKIHAAGWSATHTSDEAVALTAVSYTHLDVYKRQVFMMPRRLCVSGILWIS